ncbi:MAG: serine/threonine-protein kinase [Polyangiaceae bacterium]
MPERSVHSSQAIPPGADIPQVGELVAGKYRIEGTLGVGGMGVVLAARNELLGQSVAIKFLVIADEEYRSEATQRLLREARAAARLRGEHVVRVYDVGELPNGTPFIVMERLEGSDLGEISRLLGKLPIPVAVAFVVQAARAIAEAHAAGIVHRDLKPSNLFIVRQPDGNALLKVVDFGISKSFHADQPELKTLTGARVALGSPHYMSPEQVRDARRVDTRTDVWALGVILYELVAGRPAFHAESYPGIFAAITADVPPSLSSLRPEVSAGLERIVGRCLERDPSARYQRAEELVQALEDYRAHDLRYDELVAAADGGAQASSPHTLRAREDSLSGARPASKRSSPADAVGTVALTHTKLSAEDTGPTPEPALPSQDVPAVAQSSARFDAPVTRRSQPSEPAATASGALRHLGWVLGGIALALVVLWQLGRRQAERAPLPAPSASAASPASAWMTIETNPAGARLSEGETVYGETPLRVSLAGGAALARPRTFVLTLPGYRTHVFERAAGPDATFVHIDMVREAPAVVATAAPNVADSARAAVPPGAPRGRAPRAAPSSSATPGPDIRLVR